MRMPKVTSSFPTRKLNDEFLIPGFGSANVAVFPEPNWYAYPTTAAAISTSFEGSMYRMASFSAFFDQSSNFPARPLCAAPCSSAALQASEYVGPVLTHKATIKGVSVIGVEYHVAKN